MVAVLSKISGKVGDGVVSSLFSVLSCESLDMEVTKVHI